MCFPPASLDREFGNCIVAKGELEFKVGWTSRKVAGDADCDGDFVALFRRINDSGARVVLFTGLGHPSVNCLPPDVCMSLIADNCIWREAGRGGCGVKTVGCVKVTLNSVGQRDSDN